jgi:hypothetical protein
MARGVGLARVFLPVLLTAVVLVPLASASGPYVIGSANTVTADPNIKRPSTTPCVVPLFSDAAFYDFNVENFTYAPPSSCPGPWAKVILEADINLNAGIQYDRTANFWLGPVNVFFGTTAEPGTTLGPSWHVENDLTDYSSIFYAAQSGQADIGNIIGTDGLTSTIYASATLEFYPLAPGQTAPVTADQVFALSGGPSGGTVALNTAEDRLAGTFTFPTNVEAAYLDVYAQGQSGDEFWYACVPNDVSGLLDSCGNTAFRETEVAIDGQLAGVAPIFPWIFTGGLGDPFLWFPIPGVQTLNFTPYRVNLTPFAGLLSDGKPHTVSLGVFNANGYFSATASLLVYLDHGSAEVTGAVTKNTLTTPLPTISSKLSSTPAFIKGTVGVSSKRSFVISGYANTSHGKVTTEVLQTVNFSNNQSFDITGTKYIQDISQGTIVNSTTTVTPESGPAVIYSQNFNFPLAVDLAEVVASNGDVDVKTSANQTYENTTSTSQAGRLTYASSLSNAGQHVDTLEFDSSGDFLGNTGQASSQQYNYFDSTGKSYDCSLTAAADVLTAFSPGCAQ